MIIRSAANDCHILSKLLQPHSLTCSNKTVARNASRVSMNVDGLICTQLGLGVSSKITKKLPKCQCHDDPTVCKAFTERTILLAITNSEIFSIDSHNYTTTNTPTQFDCCFAPEQRKPLAFWLPISINAINMLNAGQQH